MSEILTCEALTKCYDKDKTALDGVDLHVNFWPHRGPAGPQRLGQDHVHQLHPAAARLRQGHHRAVRRAHDARPLRPQAPHRCGAAAGGGVRRAYRAREHRLFLQSLRQRPQAPPRAGGRGDRLCRPGRLYQVPPWQALGRPGASSQHCLRHRAQARAHLF